MGGPIMLPIPCANDSMPTVEATFSMGSISPTSTAILISNGARVIPSIPLNTIKILNCSQNGKMNIIIACRKSPAAVNMKVFTRGWSIEAPTITRATVLVIPYIINIRLPCFKEKP